MKMPENAMHFLEEHIPELAHAAVKQAYWQALASGSTVLEVENGTLVEVSPDGSRTRIKEMPPHTTVRPGQRIEIP